MIRRLCRRLGRRSGVGRCSRAGQLAALVACCLLGGGGCIEMLEVSDDDATELDDQANGVAPRQRGPIVLPKAPATSDGNGPVVPATPGLRVPDVGYWTRVRLDTADMLLPYTWLAVMPGRDHVTLRFEAVRRGVDDRGEALPSFRAVIPIAMPRGATGQELEGLSLGVEALKGATVAVRTTERDNWLISLERLTIDTMDGDTATGSLEGTARRGSRGTRRRRVEVGFVALIAPVPMAKQPAPAD